MSNTSQDDCHTCYFLWLTPLNSILDTFLDNVFTKLLLKGSILLLCFLLYFRFYIFYFSHISNLLSHYYMACLAWFYPVCLILVFSLIILWFWTLKNILWRNLGYHFLSHSKNPNLNFNRESTVCPYSTSPTLFFFQFKDW